MRKVDVRLVTATNRSLGVISDLARYHWPGNVRELQNVMAALAVAAPAQGSGPFQAPA